MGSIDRESGSSSYRCGLHLHGEAAPPGQVRRPGGRAVDATAQIRQRIAASPRRHPGRSVAYLTTLQGPCPVNGGRNLTPSRRASSVVVATLLVVEACASGTRGRKRPVDAESEY